jgi:hypothetical protein
MTGNGFKIEEWGRDDWIGALRARLKAKKSEEFGEVLKLIAVRAPELKEKACEIARGFGGEDDRAQARWEEWANSFFKTPGAQPGVDQEMPEAVSDLIKKTARDDLEHALIRELVDVFQSDVSADRLGYNSQKAEAAAALGCTQMDVHRAVQKEIENRKKPKGGDELTQSQKAIALTLRDDVQLWADQDDTTYASVLIDERWHNYQIGSREFNMLIRARYADRHFTKINGVTVPAAITNQSLHEAMSVLKARALARNPRVTVALRVGGKMIEGADVDEQVWDGEDVWIDLRSRDWRLVRVTREGWKLWAGGPPHVAFIRRPGGLALPEPVRGGDIRELQRFVNVPRQDLVLLVGWLLGALRPIGPYLVAILTGIAGAGKTTGCKVLQRLTDPNYSDLTPIGSLDDMYVAAFNRYLVAFDNVSYLTIEQSDVTCRLATGAGYSKRALRTDAEQFMMRACRPVLLNGIPDDLAERGDLADRAIVVELSALDEDTQVGEQEFWRGFAEARPRLLGALLDGVAGALKGADQMDLDGYGRIRMMDFARWAEAGCRALGFEEGEFLNAFVVNSHRAMRLAFKNDPVAQAVALFMEQNPGSWRGHAEQLLDLLRQAAWKANHDALLQDKRWPNHYTWLGRRLRRAAPVLRKVAGIQINFDVNLRPEHDGGKDGLEIMKGVGE